jgi:hypothetical protein
LAQRRANSPKSWHRQQTVDLCLACWELIVGGFQPVAEATPFLRRLSRQKHLWETYSEAINNQKDKRPQRVDQDALCAIIDRLYSRWQRIFWLAKCVGRIKWSSRGQSLTNNKLVKFRVCHKYRTGEIPEWASTTILQWSKTRSELAIIRPGIRSRRGPKLVKRIRRLLTE